MKSKIAIILAGTMLALTGATLPASAAVLNTNGQHLTSQKQSTLLLAKKKGKENAVKGGHSTGKSPSNQEKHQKGEARRNQDQNVNPAFKKYKANGGRSAKDAWVKAGQPSRD
jgi:hypothetical protein